jgi:hypothetical protein
MLKHYNPIASGVCLSVETIQVYSGDEESSHATRYNGGWVASDSDLRDKHDTVGADLSAILMREFGRIAHLDDSGSHVAS